MNNKNLISLFWPIFFEILFLMLAGSVDTLMLSSLNDKAVGAVGTANTYLSIFIIMFSIISTGMVAVMTQYIGADKLYVARQAKNIGLFLNSILSLVWVEVFHRSKVIAPIINLLISVPLNFIMNKFWAFKSNSSD